MMGIKDRSFAALPGDLSLEELVPKENFYRRLHDALDLSFLSGPLLKFVDVFSPLLSSSLR